MRSKKYSLRKTWELCLEMYKDVSKEWEQCGGDINVLKENWLERKGIGHDIVGNCFFCHYRQTHKTKFSSKSLCPRCPGAEIDRQFDCYVAKWNTNPIEFYRTLKRMHAKWKKKHPLKKC